MNTSEKHPKGLYLLFCTEMWERFSYYGMRALLVLYMVQELLFSNEKAGNIYGIYTGLVYLTPIIGGYIADKILGQRRCITIGAILMIIGLGLLSSGSKILFIPSLTFMIIANGFFKSNISSILGLLYGDNNTKKDSGYTIFYMGINLGAFFSPLVCGTLAYKFGYGCGFASAGVGMLIGLIFYKLFENKYLGEVGKYPIKEVSAKNEDEQGQNCENQNGKLICLFILMAFTIVFWTCFEQAGSSLTLFAEYSTNRNFFNFTIPTGYFQSLNPMYIILLAPFMSLIWTKLREKNSEPNSIIKFITALFLMSLSYIIMTFAGYKSEASAVSPMWLVCAYFIMTIAELCISPIGLSLVSKLAPKKFLSLMMGTWFLTSFFGNLFAGWWGGKFGTMTNTSLFSKLALISLIASVMLLSLYKKLIRLMNSAD